eukprot:1824077-Pleurochrysis_carterae.AAC.1
MTEVQQQLAGATRRRCQTSETQPGVLGLAHGRSSSAEPPLGESARRRSTGAQPRLCLQTGRLGDLSRLRQLHRAAQLFCMPHR